MDNVSERLNDPEAMAQTAAQNGYADDAKRLNDEHARLWRELRASIVWYDKPLTPEEIELEAEWDADAAAIAAEWHID